MDDNERLKQYSYVATSNLVLSSSRPKDIGPSSDVFSLRSKFTSKELSSSFGDRALKVESEELSKLKQDAKKSKRKNAEQQGVSKRVRGNHSILNTNITEGYIPLSSSTKSIWESYLSIVHSMYSSYNHDSITSLGNELLSIFKDKNMTLEAKHVKVHGILKHSGLDANLLKLKITDLYKNANMLYDYIEEEEHSDKKEEEREDAWVAVSLDEDLDDQDVYEDDDTQGGSSGTVVDIHTEDMILADEHVADKSSDTAAHFAQLHPSVVDIPWMYGQLSAFYEDQEMIKEVTDKVIALLCSDEDTRKLEQDLIDLLDFERFDAVQLFLDNRYTIVVGLALKRVFSEDEKMEVLHKFRQDTKYSEVLKLLDAGNASKKKVTKVVPTSTNTNNNDTMSDNSNVYWNAHKVIDLASIAEQATEGTVAKCVLPAQSEIIPKENCQEVHVPPMKSEILEDEKLIYINELPAYAQLGFAKMTSLNRVQSKIFPVAFETSENMLVCAPTGAGKTNCAMLTVLREFGMCAVNPMDPETTYDLKNFHIVYVAPMKSLVHEMVLNFQSRLAPYGAVVRELSGDAQLTRQEISETHVIVTTPEKWDIVTRKEAERGVLSSVRLIIIDEIHLLHDSRGPVLEAIVARALTFAETHQKHIRLVGLSATLPNFVDVAHFLRARQEHVFFFNNSYRPCPLHMQYIGVTCKQAHKRIQVSNEICAEKVFEHLGKNQVIVFTHSRKDAANTARYLLEKAREQEKLHLLVSEKGARKELLLEESANLESSVMKELIQYGIGFHHAGLCAKDRNLVEDLFAANHLQIIVATATLAWGVNLPAHAVVIKGTDVYNPEQGRWVQLSVQDVQQMVGRAGRPQYDSYGEGVLITSQDHLQFYLSLLNTQLAVESQMLSRIVDCINAEVVAGIVSDLPSAIAWVKKTFLYVRIFRNPRLYGLTSLDSNDHEQAVEQHISNILHSAFVTLEASGLVLYNHSTGVVKSTELGKTAAYYYISHKSLSLYNEGLKASLTDVELLSLFSQSMEFQHMTVRAEEHAELVKLVEMVPVPIREPVEDPRCKINVLLQAYISNINLTGFALASDMVYVVQSAARLFRALYELLLKRAWAHPAELALSFCIMIKRRCWANQSPLRQIPACPEALCRNLENKDLHWDHLCDLNSASLGELVNQPKLGKSLFKWIHQIPKIDCIGSVQPLTRSVLRVTLRLLCDFAWDDTLHGRSQPFWIFATDVDGKVLLHHELILMRKRNTDKELIVSFILPVFEPLPPYYFVKIVSDNFYGVESLFDIPLVNIILPERFAPLTSVADLTPYQIEELPHTHLQEYFLQHHSSISNLNALQTQTYNSLFGKKEGVLFAGPYGCGKTTLALASVIHSVEAGGKVVYLVPYQCQATSIASHLENVYDNERVYQYVGDAIVDSSASDEAQILVSTVEYFDNVLRKYRLKKNAWLQNITTYILDDIQLLQSEGRGTCVSLDSMAGLDGAALEGTFTRIRRVAKAFQKTPRLVCFSSPLANAKSVAEWLGTPLLFSFHSSARPMPVDVQVRGLAADTAIARSNIVPARILKDIRTYAPQTNVMVFAHGLTNVVSLAKELINLAEVAKNAVIADRLLTLQKQGVAQPNLYINIQGVSYDINVAHTNNAHPLFLRVDDATLLPHLELCRTELAEVLVMGVGIFHPELTAVEKAVVLHLYSLGALQVLVADTSCMWELSIIKSVRSSLVILAESTYFDKITSNQTPMDINLVSKLTSFVSVDRQNPLLCTLPGIKAGQFVVYSHTAQMQYLKKFLVDAYPVESNLHLRLHGLLNSEISTGGVVDTQEAVDWFTWTLCYRRLKQNPVYYNLLDISNAGISEYLSDLVSQTLEQLHAVQCIEYSQDEEEIVTMNLGRIMDHYNIHFKTIEMINTVLSSSISIRDLLWLLVSSTEIALNIGVEENEPQELYKLAKHLPLSLPKGAGNVQDTDLAYSSSAAKAHVLLQCYLTKLNTISRLEYESGVAVKFAIRLLTALVDIASSNRWLSTLISCVELIQMLSARAWTHESPLLQIPHFDKNMADFCNSVNVKSVADISEMNSTDRKQLLSTLDKKQKLDIAEYCNKYPQIEVQYAIKGDLQKDVQSSIAVMIDRTPEDEAEEEEEEAEWDDTVVFNGETRESWWIIVGDENKNVLGMKRVYIQQKITKLRVDIVPVVSGTINAKLYVMCDKYIGADQEIDLQLEIQDQ